MRGHETAGARDAALSPEGIVSCGYGGRLVSSIYAYP
jgi:hypothetical protein